MRESGATKILVHCGCGRAIQMDAGRWPDDMRLSDIELGQYKPRVLKTSLSNEEEGKLKAAVATLAQ